MQGEWLPLSVVVERIARATGDGTDFVRDEVLKLLRAGAIVGRSAYSQDIIPARDWNNTSLSKTGAAILPGIVPGSALPGLTRHPIELYLPDVLRNWAEQAGDILCPRPDAETGDAKPESCTVEVESETDATEPALASVPYKTGLAGRPSSWQLIEPEFHRRWCAGERHGSVTEWGRVLADWLKGACPSAAKTTPKTIRNQLSSSLPAKIKANL